MNALRATWTTAALVLAAGAASATGVNDVLTLNHDGSPGIIPSLTTDEASFAAASDQAKFTAALATLNAASATSLTDDVSKLAKAVKQLGKIAANATVAADVGKSVDTVYAQVYGYNAQGGAAAATYFGGKPFSIHNALVLGAIDRAAAKRIAALEATQATGKHASWTPKQKLALYLSVCKASDALIKKYGGS